jgi:hypothetical protein
MSEPEEHFRSVTRALANKIIEVVEAEASRLFSDGVEAHDIAELSVNAAMLAFAQLCATGGANETQVTNAFRRCLREMLVAMKKV